MKIVFKIGDTKIKIPYEDKDKVINAISGYYEKAFQKYMGYFSDVNEAYLKHAAKYYWNPKGNSDILPVNGHDEYNYVARYGMANFHIQAIMTFDSRLDFNKLIKAVRLSVDAEPVFGCRFIEGEPPFWKRLDNIDTVEFCTLEETNNAEESIQKYLDSPLDMDNDPMVKLKLVRSSLTDTLVLKVNHACCDGTGVKEYIQLLSEIYSAIDNGNGIYVPEPKTRDRGDQDRLFEALNITDLNAAFIPGSEILMPTWPFPWKSVCFNVFHIEKCRISKEQFIRISNAAKDSSATINDFILTAFFRSMQEIYQPINGFPMEIPITIDLRRYLPDQKTRAIRNFSGSVNTRLNIIEGETFSETLSRVKSQTNELKNGCPGLQSAIGLERIENLSFRDTLAYYNAGQQATGTTEQPVVFYGDKCVPTLSNLGLISKSLINFGMSAANDYYLVPPVVRAPGFLLMASTYNNILTLSAGYYEASLRKGDVKNLLNNIKHQLTAGE